MWRSTGVVLELGGQTKWSSKDQVFEAHHVETAILLPSLFVSATVFPQ